VYGCEGRRKIHIGICNSIKGKGLLERRLEFVENAGVGRTGIREESGSEDPPLQQKARREAEAPHLQRRKKSLTQRRGVRRGRKRTELLAGWGRWRRGWNPSRLRASMGDGSRVNYHLSIDILFTEQVIRTVGADSNGVRRSRGI